MRRLTSGVTVTTTDAVAHSVLHYARALIREGKSDLVSFPAVDDDGRVDYAELLVGPGIALVSTFSPSDVSLHDTEALKTLEARCAALESTVCQPTSPREAAQWKKGLELEFES